MVSAQDGLTPAGRSNRLPFAPQIYEHLWRPRALTILTGKKFPFEREAELVRDWLSLPPGARVLDLGSSTDRYARALGRDDPAARIVAIDLAMGMLQAGRAYSRRGGIENIAHLCAPVERLPFADASVDALVCGGSLNEFRSMEVALVQARRVCRPEGRMLAMSLIAARSRLGRFAQRLAGAGGIRFPGQDEFNGLVRAAGWQIERQECFGVVVFSLLRPGEAQPPKEKPV